MPETQDKILEALAGLIPETAQEKIAGVVTSLINDAVANLESEYDARLQEGYKIMADKRAEDWETAKKGYRQAYEVIEDLRNRLALQKEESEQATVEEFEHAYQMLLAERQKNIDIEGRMYESFNNELSKVKEYMVDKMDQFLAEMGSEYYEAAKTEVLNDPYLAEHKVAFEKVLEVTSRFLTEEDAMLSTSSRIEELEHQLEQVEAAKQRAQSKSMKLMTENTQMAQYLKETKALIEQGLLQEQNERLVQARNTQGRGNPVVEPEREVLLGETVNRTATVESNVGNDEPRDIVEQWQYLAGYSNK